MQKVFITSSKTRNLSGVGKVSGRPYSMDFQDGFLYEVSPDGEQPEFPSKFEFVLEKENISTWKTYRIILLI